MRLKSTDTKLPLGLSVEPVMDAANKFVPNYHKNKNILRLQSLRVTKVLPLSRAAQDGRLAVGDLLTAIGSRPVYQMSYIR